MTDRFRIVVHGDVAIDRLTAPVPPLSSTGSGAANWLAYPGTRELVLPGGAMMLAQLVRSATEDFATVHGPCLEHLEALSTREYVHSFGRLDLFPRSDDRKQRVYRIREHCGFSGPENGAAVIPALDEDAPDAQMVILDDVGNGFRDEPDSWPKALESGQPLVILKMNTPLATGPLWDRLQRDHRDRLIVVVGVSDLRHAGARISRRLSWERTAVDLVRELEKPPLAELKNCAHLIVRFGVEGAMVRTADGMFEGTRLFYDPELQEEGFADAHEGQMIGVTNAFVAGIARALAKHGMGGVIDGIRQGLVFARRLYEAGLGTRIDELGLPGKELFAKPREGERLATGIRVPSASATNGDSWAILQDAGPMGLVGSAANYVLTGGDPILDKAPLGRFGKLATIDREEIESYRAIQNVIREYVRRSSGSQPLSIATFGPPGSGKSFGISQVAFSAVKDLEIEILDFDLSQFGSSADLVAAFHRVRDVGLAGKLPIAFFDEFDSHFGGRLGWLKHFLVPMQSGVFREGETLHPIGRAIFVFAGGTSSSFAEFSLAGDQKSPKGEEFVKAKGPDFVSRLRGFIDVKGINPRGDETLHVVRRAIILRVLFQSDFKQFLDARKRIKADPSVIRALLTIPKYAHGVRSMRAILEMSLLSGNRQFERSALPSPQQLSLHTDAAELEAALAESIRVEHVREKLAQSIHEEYRASQRAKKKPKPNTDPAMADWEDLDEIFKESNRRQADHIPTKLAAIGCILRTRTTESSAVPALPFDVETPEGKQTLDMLAEMEHERWNAERFMDGWCYGPERDAANRISPYLVPWSELSEEIREYDRDAICALPKLLHELGFEIVPVESRRSPGTDKGTGAKRFGLSVKAAVRDRAGRVLLLRRSPESKSWPEKWDLVGGAVDAGEAFDQALIREAREEAGIEIKVAELIGSSQFTVRGLHIVQLNFWADLAGGTITLSDEHSEAKWFDVADLPAEDLAETVRDALAPILPGQAADR